jgi:cytosine/adenosine deaminase-related metal-dependent hydrolase
LQPQPAGALGRAVSEDQGHLLAVLVAEFARIEAAEMIRADRAFGTIEVGKRADLLMAKRKNPWNVRTRRTLEAYKPPLTA